MWIDRHRRTIVDSKPFFPLGFYAGGHSQGLSQKYWKQSPFNCVMSYSLPTVEDMDCVWTNGLMVFISLKDAYVRKDARAGLGGAPPVVRSDAESRPSGDWPDL